MIEIIYQVFAMPLTALGALVFVKTIIVPMKAPADTTNRIAHLILIYEALFKPEDFVKGKDRDYLKHDIFRLRKD